MDNLSHTAFSAVVTAAVYPSLVAKLRLRLLAVGALIANLPDIDILLLFLGRETYFFQHRGLTHSIFGLFLMLPLSWLIFRWLLPAQKWSKGSTYPGHGFIFGFSLLHLVVSHFLLDYLTTYGTMFLFPLSWQRFSYPLMFIIDPLFWIVVVSGAIYAWRPRLSPGKICKRAMLSLLACFMLWGGEFYFKKDAEKAFLSAINDKKGELISYPAPLAPLVWLILHHSHSDYQQGVVTFFSERNVALKPVPTRYNPAGFCRSGKYTKEALESYARFKSWGEHAVCEPFKLKQELGCRCFSLKYSIALSGVITYGGFFVPEDRPGFFLLPDDRSKLLKYYEDSIFSEKK